MMAETAFEEVNKEFAVRRETLGKDGAWKQHQSAGAAYELSDFLDSAGRPRASLMLPLIILIVGLSFALSLFIAGTNEFSQPQEEIRILTWAANPTNTAFAGVAGIFSIVASIMFLVTQNGAQRVWDSLDRWKYVAPGWGVFRFTFGTAGIGVDGNHFLFFLEWDEIKFVRETPEKLELQNPEGQILVIPSRFFEPNQGGDIGWQAAKDLIRSSTDAQWH